MAYELTAFVLSWAILWYAVAVFAGIIREIRESERRMMEEPKDDAIRIPEDQSTAEVGLDGKPLLPSPAPSLAFEEHASMAAGLLASLLIEHEDKLDDQSRLSWSGNDLTKAEAIFSVIGDISEAIKRKNA